MRVVLCLCIAAYVAAVPASPYASVNNMIEEINARNVWVAGHNGIYSNPNNVQHLLGVPLDKVNFIPEDFPKATIDANSAVPSSFDPRQKWKGCIGPILDQAECGSCWAFGAAETASDRKCISAAENGLNATFLQLAPLDLVECGGEGGCEGGMPYEAMEWIKDEGLVTEKCLPYLKSEGGPIPTCSDEPCLNFVDTPSCKRRCSDSSSYESDKHKLAKVYSVDASQLKAELSTNGPVEVAFTVYEDFLHYKSGVYKHTSGSALGGHAVKMIGYGTENGQDYWLVQNSWTTSWGDGGYFKIAPGECGIDDSAVTGSF
eukprot:CAMPEP_0175855522 /NCGR_PEP_ID=MMETSP0107_2-20121207/27972_1 /TAXON_ID=195067 ORGANISM="Goniomonas pacifica, Strain CCMP1869" /NCGR_SAMPLE_ID=MMETSP0107_2 /ASSEMBLY_ACC=CAM_ASM_000203 /LENGTH=316 /DNA_ID=CAMNT_0017171491 /DNA_START=8 /DNA_END=958 /DNA_ORIENTATION=+